jgi:hypothetical protein
VRAIAKQAEAERERRAKVINAEGELQASRMLTEAASVIGREPAAIQLRYLQTVAEIATENNSTTIFPIPIDMFRAFFEKSAAALGKAAEAPVESEPAEADPKALPGTRVENALPKSLHDVVAGRRKSGGQDSA